MSCERMDRPRTFLVCPGFYLKQAQTVSTRDEFVPPQYLAFCKRMQDKVRWAIRRRAGVHTCVAALPGSAHQACQPQGGTADASRLTRGGPCAAHCRWCFAPWHIHCHTVWLRCCSLLSASVQPRSC